MKITSKAYECIKCGKEEEHETNHWGSIYNIPCSVCETLTEWKVSEEIPDGAWVPEPWTDTATISVLPTEDMTPEPDSKRIELNKRNWPFFKIALEEANRNKAESFVYGGMRFKTIYARCMITALDQKISTGWTQEVIQYKVEEGTK